MQNLDEDVPMELNQKKIVELQEKLILIYKYVKQEKMYEKFFFKSEDVKNLFKGRNKLINELLEMDNYEEFLKTCIMELEELKEGYNKDLKVSLADIMEKQDFQLLYHKYGLKNLDDVDKLDLKNLMDYI